jgi:hypothetical protein
MATKIVEICFTARVIVSLFALYVSAPYDIYSVFLCLLPVLRRHRNATDVRLPSRQGNFLFYDGLWWNGEEP